MPKEIPVALSWKKFTLRSEDTWKTTTLPALLKAGIDPKHVKRCVYVIRLNGSFCIQYPKGQSPVVYIGEGRLGARITSHRRWVKHLDELVGDYAFQVWISTPRVQNNEEAYRDCEAALLKRFGERFGSTPLCNLQFEKRRFKHHVYSEEQMDAALGKRSGAKYHWAIQPMPASPFYSSFGKAKHAGA